MWEIVSWGAMTQPINTNPVNSSTTDAGLRKTQTQKVHNEAEYFAAFMTGGPDETPKAENKPATASPTNLSALSDYMQQLETGTSEKKH